MMRRGAADRDLDGLAARIPAQSRQTRAGLTQPHAKHPSAQGNPRAESLLRFADTRDAVLSAWRVIRGNRNRRRRFVESGNARRLVARSREESGQGAGVNLQSCPYM